MSKSGNRKGWRIGCRGPVAGHDWLGEAMSGEDGEHGLDRVEAAADPVLDRIKRHGDALWAEREAEGFAFAAVNRFDESWSLDDLGEAPEDGAGTTRRIVAEIAGVGASGGLLPSGKPLPWIATAARRKELTDWYLSGLLNGRGGTWNGFLDAARYAWHERLLFEDAPMKAEPARRPEFEGFGSSPKMPDISANIRQHGSKLAARSEDEILHDEVMMMARRADLVAEAALRTGVAELFRSGRVMAFESSVGGWSLADPTRFETESPFPWLTPACFRVASMSDCWTNFSRHFFVERYTGFLAENERQEAATRISLEQAGRFRFLRLSDLGELASNQTATPQGGPRCKETRAKERAAEKWFIDQVPQRPVWTKKPDR